jgi:hypothetical protein
MKVMLPQLTILEKPDVWVDSEMTFAPRDEVGEKEVYVRADVVWLQRISIEDLQKEV